MDPVAAAVFHVMLHHFSFHPVTHLHVMVHHIRIHTAGVNHHRHMMDWHLRDVPWDVVDVFRHFWNIFWYLGQFRRFWNIFWYFG